VRRCARVCVRVRECVCLFVCECDCEVCLFVCVCARVRE
jgi:hypothetical protein